MESACLGTKQPRCFSLLTGVYQFESYQVKANMSVQVKYNYYYLPLRKCPDFFKYKDDWNRNLHKE